MLSNRDIQGAVTSVKELADACEEAQDALKSLRSLAEDVVAAHDNEDQDAMARAVAALRKELP